MSKTGFMQRPLWISAAAITDAYTVNTFSASYLDTAGSGVLEVFKQRRHIFSPYMAMD